MKMSENIEEILTTDLMISTNYTEEIFEQSSAWTLPIPSTIISIIAILSIPLFIFLFYWILKLPELRTAIHYHVVILLLIFSCMLTVIDIPVQLAYYYTGRIQIKTISYCVFSYLIDYLLFSIIFSLIAWGSFERHILIFHSRLFQTRLSRLLGHYFPLLFCCFYPFFFYVYFLAIYPCPNFYDEATEGCSRPCYLTDNDIVATYEQLVHGFIPILLTFVFNLALLIRVIYQKYRVGQRVGRRKSVKLMVQLLCICFLVLFTSGGYFLIEFVQLLWDPNFAIGVAEWTYPITLCLAPLIPFTLLLTMHEIRQKLVILCFRRHQSSVYPVAQLTISTRRVQNPKQTHHV